VRLQRSFFSFLRRYVDLTQARSLEVAPIILPTIDLGRDFVDQERGTFGWGDFGSGGAGDVSVIHVVPALGDVEILAAWVTRPGGALDASFEFDAAPATIAPSLVIQRSSRAGRCNAAIFATHEPAPWSLGTLFTAPQNVTLFLPLAGTIVEVGRRLRFGSNNPGVTVAVGVLARNLGGE
jgi:hypothetical protein